MKLYRILIAAAVMFGAAALTAEAEELPIYSTDILTMLDGVPIQGYNIGGETLISLDDLDDHGFTVAYDDSIRTLFVNKTHEACTETAPEIKRSSGGNIIGYTVDTDIKAYVNGHYIKSYVVEGKLAASTETLGDRTKFSRYGISYTAYNMECSYNNDDRMLSINTAPSDEASYEEKLNGFYEYFQADRQYIPADIEEKGDEYTVVLLDENKSDGRTITHIFMIYRNGLFIDISSILDSAYGFAAFPYLTVFEGSISADKTSFSFYGERYKPTGMRSTEFIESGNYSVDLYSGTVSKIS